MFSVESSENDTLEPSYTESRSAVTSDVPTTLKVLPSSTTISFAVTVAFSITADETSIVPSTETLPPFVTFKLVVYTCEPLFSA